MSDYLENIKEGYQKAKNYLVDGYREANEELNKRPEVRFIKHASDLLKSDTNSTEQGYDIEPFMPAVSPPNKLPNAVPEYMPYNYSKMTPGNYFIHDTAYERTQGLQPSSAVDEIYKKGLAPTPKDAVSDIYKKGLAVRAQGHPGGFLEPTAWNNKISKDQLGGYNQNRALMQRMGSHGSTYEGVGRSPFYATTHGTDTLPKSSRLKTSSKTPVVVLKGDENLLTKEGPDLRKLTPAQAAREPGYWNKPYGYIDPKKIEGVFPQGSNELMVKRPVGMFTGRLPTFRGMGSGLVDIFTSPFMSQISPHETQDIFGNPIDQGSGIESEMIPSHNEYDYEIERLEYPDQGGTVPMTYGPKMVPNPRAGKARNPHPII